MKFEVGKFYKTRDGRKAQIFMLDSGNHQMLGAVLTDRMAPSSEWIPQNWYGDGRVLLSCTHSADIVGEWKDPIRYSVTLWGTEFAPMKDAANIEGFVFGMKGEWCEKPIPKCPIKYRVTVEEIVEGEVG